jgi:hypothetical protein
VTKFCFEIWVPCEKPPHWPGKKRYFSTKYHRQWDSKVVALAGGISIMHPAKGSWVFQDKLFSERMIPVRVSCTDEQFVKIRDLTGKYYGQLAIFCIKLGQELTQYFPENEKYHNQQYP